MGGEEGDKPRIRMTLFSRVEAVVPNGPTYLDLVDIQDEGETMMGRKTWIGRK